MLLLKLVPLLPVVPTVWACATELAIPSVNAAMTDWHAIEKDNGGWDERINISDILNT